MYIYATPLTVPYSLSQNAVKMKTANDSMYDKIEIHWKLNVLDISLEKIKIQTKVS